MHKDHFKKSNHSLGMNLVKRLPSTHEALSSIPSIMSPRGRYRLWGFFCFVLLFSVNEATYKSLNN